MILKTFSQVREGDFVRYKGHRLNPGYTDVWHKVTRVEHGRLTLVNRHQREKQVTWDTAKHGGIRFLVWEPGDPRQDGPLAGQRRAEIA